MAGNHDMDELEQLIQELEQQEKILEAPSSEGSNGSGANLFSGRAATALGRNLFSGRAARVPARNLLSERTVRRLEQNLLPGMTARRPARNLLTRIGTKRLAPKEPPERTAAGRRSGGKSPYGRNRKNARRGR